MSISTAKSPPLHSPIHNYLLPTTVFTPMSSFELHHALRGADPGSSNATSPLFTVTSLHNLYALVSSATLTSLLPAVAVLYICGVASVALYRLYFHPISRFPGPRIAAVTGWYQAYYDIWKGGKMTQNIAVLHKKYGEFPSASRVYI